MIDLAVTLNLGRTPWDDLRGFKSMGQVTRVGRLPGSRARAAVKSARVVSARTCWPSGMVMRSVTVDFPLCVLAADSAEGN